MSLTPEELTEIVSRVVSELQDPTPTPQAIDLTHFQVVTGQVIQADHVNSLANQSIPKYSTKAALTADWPAPSVGSMAYVIDTNILHVFDNQITGQPNAWRPLGGLRMGFARMGGGQSIPGGSVSTLVKLTEAGGAANKAGRATWAANGEVTVPITGTYLVTGGVTWPAKTPASGERRCYVMYNAGGGWGMSGTAGGVAELNTGAVGTTVIRQGVSSMIYAGAGTKIGMFVQHSASSALVLPNDAADMARMGVHLLASD